ncbi:hypothetical protein J2X31_000037 [Flavobacterium arsenatis]|uniref:Glycine-rich domain-containing protein n=1 Tax=Flavobacterium arsenatis TaxID=1484332 RepID=A0ABU1TJ87_9FLAO|nr:T9SS sorting signal type C domain-containing protein [Flavobacterium arsenatis]MDR6966044.1 hypothetical protein [Flavobacterium arsenatis]
MKKTKIALDKIFRQEDSSILLQKVNSFNFSKIYFFLFMICSANLYSQTTVILPSGSTNWTVPCGVTSITVEVWGAGGAGGGVTGNPSAGGGGSGGGYVSSTFTVTPNASIAYSVGAGGNGSNGTVNKNGGSSWFISNTTLLAIGGNGAANLTTNTNFGAGALAPTTGNIGGTLASSYGGRGGNGIDAGTDTSGGGGSSAGTTAPGNTTGITGGTAPTNGYAGANGRNSNDNGITGGVGAGGSGGRANTATDRLGGNGGAGQIRITYTVGAVPSSSLPYGNNVWNVHAWNGGDISGGSGAWSTDYRGFYVNSNLDFNTVAHWGINASPSSATGWTGCTVDIDNFSFAAKRQGFPCGLYRIDVLRNDDIAQLYINDILVWSRVDWSGDGATPASNLNVWTGTLGPNDRVELRISEGAGGADGHITFTVVSPTAPTLTGPASNIICSGTTATLNATGSNVATAASTLWFQGASCPTIGFVQEFETMPYVATQTTVNSLASGILNLTSANATPADPMIYMEDVLLSAINPTVQRYISMRYRVVAGTAIMTEVYFKKGALALAEDKVVRGNLISDGSWHVLSIDMGANSNWNNTGGNITGWRFDYTTGANVTMEIDYIVLASLPVMENTATDDSSIIVSPTVSPTSYTVLKVAESSCGTLSACSTTQIYVNKTWIGGTGDWNVAANWSPSGVPTSDQCVVGTSGNITVNANGNAKKVTLTNTTALTIPSNNTLTVVDEINIGVNAAFTIQDSGSLVQENNTTNTGNITFIRNAKPMKRYDFTYWSSPVAAQNLDAVSPMTLFDKYFSWNPTTGAWITHSSDTVTMKVGRGYIIRAPQYFSTTTPANFTANFIGTPNNGEISYTEFQGSGTTQVWNLIGNPYPSAIDIDLFIGDPDNTEVGGAIYLWTHNTPALDNGSGTFSYTSNDYAVYNSSGGIATAAPNDPNDTTDDDDNNSTPINGHVAAGQSFFIRGLASGTVKFKNTMRIAGNNSNFYKPVATDPAENWQTTGKHRFWINLRNNQGAFNQALVGYIEGATDDIDRLYDAELWGGNYVTIYSLFNQNKLTIQGKALPFNTSDVVPLGYKATIAGTFNISLGGFDGLFEGQDVFLKDNLLNTIHNLKDGNYTFTSAIGTFDNRFEIVYQSEALSTDNPESNPDSIFIYKDSNSTIAVNSGQILIEEIKVYDISGRLLSQEKNINRANTLIRNLPETHQVLIVEVVSVDGFKTTKKIVF